MIHLAKNSLTNHVTLKMTSTNKITETNQSRVEFKTVKMPTRSFLILICLTTLVTLINGYDLKGERQAIPPTLEECMKPPMTKFGHECCKLPKEKIWGDLRGSLSMCLRKMKQESKSMKQEMEDDGREMVTPAVSDVITSTEDPSQSVSVPNTSPHSSNPRRRDRRPHGKKTLAERLKELFSSVFNEIENTFTALWQSVVIITDHLHRRANDSCFMECVFEDQGFLLDKMINKEALLNRLTITLGRNEPWHKVAVEAVETCYIKLITAPSNATCHSGAEEMFRCVLKHIFFNCPNWAQNNYCMSLREFYQKCPNGPPPEISDNHTTVPTPDEDIESQTSTESEKNTETE